MTKDPSARPGSGVAAAPHGRPGLLEDKVGLVTGAAQGLGRDGGVLVNSHLL